MNTQLEIFQENVRKLGQITSRLSTGKVQCGSGPPTIFELEDGGEARVWVLHERDTATIAKAYLSPGATFPVHQHNAVEVIVLIEGTALYESETTEKPMMPGSCVSVSKGKAHRVTAGMLGAWFSVTTVPREAEMTFQGGGENGR